ncbi:MAG: TonB-dependent hemoglobin/transferrin/lactoferrin family receptor [Proteobacteria bacterium]|nr:TonB-dependent hemoglobin/transferrin/lactoferrin family receptor [Pseudomonadota bacterium]
MKKKEVVRRWACCGSALWWFAPVQAQMSPEGPVTRLPEVAVSATGVEEDTAGVPATISTIDAQQIDRGLVRTLRDLIRYEPGVSVNNDPNRFGANSFNIRGLEGNRVQMLVDGIRAPSLFQFGVGPFNNSTRSFVDLDSVKRVEILRGPASSLYGSDALGGVVSYMTKDPLDYLDLATSPFYGAFKSAFASADTGWANTGTVAYGTQLWQALAQYTYFGGSQQKNMGTDNSVGAGRTEPNPQDVRQQNLLLKGVLQPAPGHRVRATYEWFDRNSMTDVFSLNSTTPRTASISGDDDNNRQRYSLDYAYTNPARGWLAGFTANLYRQTSSTDSSSSETRVNTTAGCSGVFPGTNTCFIPRQFDFEQRITGLAAQLESLLDGGGIQQRILWGLDLSDTDSSALRDATIYNQTLGTVSKTLSGETFPLRDFPNTSTRQLGLYVQDQISLLDDRLVVTPALRYDDYRLKIHPDAIYLANVPPGVQATDFSDSAWSPKLALMYRVNADLNVYGNYAFGFRAPPFDDVNAAFRNPVQSYVLIPNPNLVSETSRGLEIGVKGRAGDSTFAVAAFYNRYKNFIDSSTQLDCPTDPNCVPGYLGTFQATNVARVRIYGVEAKGEWLLDRHWALAGSIAYANGRNETLDQPLNSISPLTGVAGLRYSAGAWGGSLNITGVSSKNSAASVGGVQPFLTPGFGLVDITAYWDISKNLRLAGGIFNVFDKEYWLWSNVGQTGLAATSPALDRYTQPGINVAVNLQLVY